MITTARGRVTVNPFTLILGLGVRGCGESGAQRPLYTDSRLQAMVREEASAGCRRRSRSHSLIKQLGTRTRDLGVKSRELFLR